VPYDDVQHEPIVLPEREHKPDYARTPVPETMYVPAVY
jgi:polyphosphate kinase